MRRAARGWIAGPLAATATLVGLGFALPSLYASGGGLLIAAAGAIGVGSAVAGLTDPPRRAVSTAVVAVYVATLVATYLVIMQITPPPPGTARGGFTVPAPSGQPGGVREDFATLGEGTTAAHPDQTIEAGFRMFSAPDFGPLCARTRAAAAVRLQSSSSRVELRVGEPFPLRRLTVIAVDTAGNVLPGVPISIESAVRPSILDVRSDRIGNGAVTPTEPGVTHFRVRTICPGAGAELFIPAVVVAP